MESATRNTAGSGRTAAGTISGGSLEGDAVCFHEALSELLRFYQFRDRDRICCFDVSVTQCYALETIVRQGPMRLNELAAGLYLDKSTASRVVDALESKGYVRRRPDPDDGRALGLEATARGRRLYERIERDLVAQERELIEEFEPEVRRGMIRVIERLTAAARRCADGYCTVGTRDGGSRDGGDGHG